MRNPDPTAEPAPGSFSRRDLLVGSAALALMPGMASAQGTASAQSPTGKAPPPEPKSIKAAAAKLRLKPDPAPETAVWRLGEAEAPILRIKLGEAIRLRVENGTDQPLSLHWHGVRIANAMDGVGGVTQEPIKPGASFTYDFTPPDAGSFLIRPLVVGGSSEPSGRGIASMLIVEEPAPPPVDGDLALLVQDWRLDEAGALQPFGQVALPPRPGGSAAS